MMLFFFVQTLLGTVNLKKKTPALLSPLAGSPEASLEYLEPGEKYFLVKIIIKKDLLSLGERKRSPLELAALLPFSSASATYHSTR